MGTKLHQWRFLSTHFLATVGGGRVGEGVKLKKSIITFFSRSEVAFTTSWVCVNSSPMEIASVAMATIGGRNNKSGVSFHKLFKRATFDQNTLHLSFIKPEIPDDP
ncbi:hypothetical protein K1T71_013800 [Dendrolimus kikuchii]|uniref:Uncharacterized protein n=1 Tax=Dendrolimus kikuchii TaxID=765133 RepID=A0ACC1CFS4_9NEOP|nr:hypothetical protein K1T71_013800 [Dendrolimus kikuchii]